jgi:hypothetical protein
VHVYIYKYCYLDKNSGSPWLILTSLICHCFHYLFYTEELKFETFLKNIYIYIYIYIFKSFEV